MTEPFTTTRPGWPLYWHRDYPAEIIRHRALIEARRRLHTSRELQPERPHEPEQKRVPNS